MRKQLIVALAFLSICLGCPGSVAAADGDSLLFGQRHAYTVVFRGNGEAVVLARIALTNGEERPLTEIPFEVPGVPATELTAYQVKLPQTCARIDYAKSDRPCLEYQDPDYGQAEYYYNYERTNGKTEYVKAQIIPSGNGYRLLLPHPVQPNASTAFLIAYASKSYAKDRFGLYAFRFETLKVASRIQSVEVTVDVDSDLYLKGKRSSVDYETSVVPVMNVGESASLADSPNFDRTYRSIGGYGPIMKEGKNLAPHESLIVDGSYARSWFRLYLLAIILTLLIVAGAFVGIYYASKLIRGRRAARGAVRGSLSATSAGGKLGTISVLNLTNAGIGLLSTALVFALSFGVTTFSDTEIFYRLDGSPVFALVGVILMLLSYAFVIFGPASIVAVKRGWKTFLSIVLAEFLWLALAVSIYIFFFGEAAW